MTIRIKKKSFEGDSWFDEYVNTLFEVVEIYSDNIPPYYAVDISETDMHGRKAYVPFSCAEVVEKAMNLGKSQHQVSTRERILCIDLYYPRTESNVNAVEISLVDVRAADSIRISYDFGRDGWKIEQASVFEWEADDTECDPGWQEVSFIQAWGLE